MGRPLRMVARCASCFPVRNAGVLLSTAVCVTGFSPVSTA